MEKLESRACVNVLDENQLHLESESRNFANTERTQPPQFSTANRNRFQRRVDCGEWPAAVRRNARHDAAKAATPPNLILYAEEAVEVEPYGESFEDETRGP